MAGVFWLRASAMKKWMQDHILVHTVCKTNFKT